MSRDDLLLANYEVVKSATEQAAKYSPNAILIAGDQSAGRHVLEAAFQVSKFPKNRVIGMAGVLDTARFRTFIAAGTECLGGERDRGGAGRPRRHHGADRRV